MSSNDNNKNTCTRNSHAIMSLIDENKDDIPEGLYLNLCNLLKKQNEEEGKEDRFYKVTYLYSSPGQRLDDHWDMNLRVKNDEILKLSEPEYRTIQDEITNKGYSYSFAEKLSQYGMGHSYSRIIRQECEECDEQSPVEATTCLISRCCIVSIKPA